MKKLLLLFLMAAALMGVGRLWYLAKDGFSFNRLAYSLQSQQSEPPETIAPLLQQTFTYLGRGRQSYAFQSQDETLVLKIPRFDRYRLPFFWKAMPGFFGTREKQEILTDRQNRLAFTLGSIDLASNELSEQTGIVYSHFRSTQTLPGKCYLKDALGRTYCINPNLTPFLLQRKLPLWLPQLIQAMEQREISAAQELLLAFLDLLDLRAKLCIFNKDPSFRRNFAMEKGKAVQIDVGSFYRKPNVVGEKAFRCSLIEGTEPLRQWLEERDPELLAWFKERLSEKIPDWEKT